MWIVYLAVPLGSARSIPGPRGLAPTRMAQSASANATSQSPSVPRTYASAEAT